MKKTNIEQTSKSRLDPKNTFVNKKNTLLEKLTLHFSNRLKNLMQQKDYSSSNLKRDITKFIETLEKTNINKYDLIIGKIEEILLENINNPRSNHSTNNENFLGNNNNNKKKSVTLDDLYKYEANEYNKSNFIYSSYSNQNSYKNKDDYENLNNIIQKDQKNDKIAPSPNAHQQYLEPGKELPWVGNQKHEKIENLKEKANDEWALIAKFNNLKLLEDQKENKYIKEEKQKKFKELLHSQLMEKDILKKRKQDEDWQFFLKQNDKLHSLNEVEVLKKKARKDILKSEKEIQDKMICDSRIKKNEMINQDKLNDKIALERIRVDIEIEKERAIKKKSDEREMYLSLIRENEIKQEIKKNQKELENLNNKRYVQEFEEMLEKQEKERHSGNPRLLKVNDHYEAKTLNAKVQEDQFKSYQENKYLKEKSEIENK